MADFNGDSGDNSVTGTDSADNFFMQIGGGHDTVDARGGDDSIFFGDTYGRGDVVDGGDGDDRVNLQGDYSAGVTVDFTNVERLQLSSGGFDYKITVAADCFTVAGGFAIDGTSLGATDSFRANLRADSAGQSVTISDFAADFTIKGGAADETFIYGSVGDAGKGSFSGGAGDDTVVLPGPNDLSLWKLNGGAGFDTLVLSPGEYIFDTHMSQQFEQVTLSGGSFVLHLFDANVAKGHSLTIDGSALGPGQTLNFIGIPETDGAFSVIGGAGDDVMVGGAGGDTLTGGDGADSFLYFHLSDSSGAHKHFDLITDLEATDLIDLSTIDAKVDRLGNQQFHMVNHFKGHSGELVLSYDAGTDLTTVAGDVDGDGKADLSIHISGDHTDFTNFLL